MRFTTKLSLCARKWAYVGERVAASSEGTSCFSVVAGEARLSVARNGNDVMRADAAFGVKSNAL